MRIRSHSPAFGRIRRWGWPRRLEVIQFPNPPLILALGAELAARATHGGAHRGWQAVHYLALTVWAYEEAAHGSNPLRRALGAGVLVYLAVGLSEALR